MRIERIGIDGFGHFAGAEVGPLDGRLSVIAGANEAGKSTLLAFIRTVLFGFPAQRSDRHYPPLAGGRHGGRLRVTTSDGRGFVVQRHRGPRGGEPEITTAEGQRCDGSMLGLITGHAPADLFQSVFAFSLAELQGLSNEASERIYSAGTGAARLPKALQDLEKAQKEIFVPKGSKHEVAKVLNELHGVESKLGGVAAQASEYGQLTERHSAISRSMAEIEARRGELSARAHELDRLLRAWAEWEPMRAIEGQLQALPRYEEFPEDAMGRLDALERQIGQLELDRNQAREELEERRQAAEAEVPDEALVEEKETIEAIRRGRGSLDASLRDLPEREAELRSLEQEIGESLR